MSEQISYSTDGDTSHNYLDEWGLHYWITILLLPRVRFSAFPKKLRRKFCEFIDVAKVYMKAVLREKVDSAQA